MPLLHVVALRFKEGITDEEIENHFKTEVNLKERMPGWFRSPQAKQRLLACLLCVSLLCSGAEPHPT